MASLNLERAKDILDKIPYSIVAALIVAYMGWDYYYNFAQGDTSPKIQKEAQITDHENKIAALNKKKEDAKEFFRTLERRRIELRSLAQQLDEMKATLNDQLDVPLFMKTVFQEASKVGLTVLGLKPTVSKMHEYYAEQTFDLNISGVYVQLLVFLDHLSNIDRITRVDNFELKRTGSATAPFVNLGGRVEIRAYYYLGTHADEVATNLKNGTNAPQSTTPKPEDKK